MVATRRRFFDTRSRQETNSPVGLIQASKSSGPAVPLPRRGTTLADDCLKPSQTRPFDGEMRNSPPDSQSRVASWVKSQQVDELVAVRRSLFDELQDSLLASQVAHDRLHVAVINCLQGTYATCKEPQGLAETPPLAAVSKGNHNGLAGLASPSISLDPAHPMMLGDCTPCFAQQHDLSGLDGLPHSIECGAAAGNSNETLPRSWLDSSSSQCSDEELAPPDLVQSSRAHDDSPGPLTDGGEYPPGISGASVQEEAQEELNIFDGDDSPQIYNDAHNTSNHRLGIVTGLRKKVSRLFARHQTPTSDTVVMPRTPLQVRNEEMTAYLQAPDEASPAPRPIKRLPRVSNATPVARTVLTRRSAPSLRV